MSLDVYNKDPKSYIIIIIIMALSLLRERYIYANAVSVFISKVFVDNTNMLLTQIKGL